MQHSKRLCLAILIVCTGWGAWMMLACKQLSAAECNQAPAGDPEAQFAIAPDYGRLPLYFIANRGQLDRRVQYYVKTGAQTLYFTRREIVLALRSLAPEAALPSRPPLKAQEPPPPRKLTVVRIKPLGLQRQVVLTAREQTECRVNYFLGWDPRRWYTDLYTYRAVVYENAYAGIDLKFYGRGRELEYDIVVRPGADPGKVQFAYEGVRRLELMPTGDLALILPDGGRLIQRKPVVYQEINGVRVARAGGFRLAQGRAKLICGFAVAAYDKNHPLIIDPILSYGTYLGGNASDLGTGIAVDASGAAYVCGATVSDNFPVYNYLQENRAGSNDVFIAKLTPAGNALSYATYLGGSANDYGYGIAVDANGQALVVGNTESNNFPMMNAFQNTRAGASDVFVAKLGPAGNTLIYSTYLGGSGYDYGRAIAVDAAGAAYLTGYTYSGNFPLQNPCQDTKAGSNDVFVAKLGAAGNTLIYSTYLGGSEGDFGAGIAVDASGAAYITGYTSSDNFPTQNPFQRTRAGESEVFVTKLGPAGNTLSYSTYLGGSQNDYGYGIAVTPDGTAYIIGATSSTNFPLQNPLQLNKAGGTDIFAVKLNPAGNALVYSTYLGGSADDAGYGIKIDANGAAYLVGNTNSADFPIRHPFQRTKSHYNDVFVAKLSPAGDNLRYSTYLGGNGDDYGKAIALDAQGAAYVTGYTYSNDFPTWNPFQGTRVGSADTFIAKLEEVAKPVPLLELLLLQ